MYLCKNSLNTRQVAPTIFSSTSASITSLSNIAAVDISVAGVSRDLRLENQMAKAKCLLGPKHSPAESDFIEPHAQTRSRHPAGSVIVTSQVSCTGRNASVRRLNGLTRCTTHFVGRYLGF